jgi:hypothetical protein
MRLLIVLALLFPCNIPHAQTIGSRLPPAHSAIRQSDLQHDLFYLAGDSMRGRRAGTADELRAAAWVAQQAQKAGLRPAGDDGTYFQYFPLQRTVTAANSEVRINANNLRLWKDAWVIYPIEANVNGTVLWLPSLADTAKAEIKGSIVAMTIVPPTPLPPGWMSLWGFRYVYIALLQQSKILKAHGAKAVLVVADSTATAALTSLGHVLDFEEGSYDLPGDVATAGNDIPVILVDRNEAAALQQSGASVTANLHVNSFVYPSVNVVAEVPGTDANLKKEYVLFSGHHDHDGVGAPIAGDSVWNGADDNASVSVALLAIGRAFVKQPAKRSCLFVWHGAEERGLFGSRWYAAHPTVTKENIVAVLNGDMIGRNHPDSAALLGVTKPHRNSMDLVNAAYKANEQTGHFKIDTTWDNAAHPEFWYFRSDHLPYAQAGIPAIFFTTLLHADYHTPKDEADRIDYPKLKRMTDWMYATGWTLANAIKRPALDSDVKTASK